MNSKSLGERISRQVVRAFYDDVHVVVFDGLLLETTQPVNDTDLAQSLNLPPKIVRTCLQALKRDGFVQERSQRQAANAKKATIFLWSFNSERFARVFRYRMLMVRKRASALASQAIAEETFICSSPDCFYHSHNLSTIDAIEGCRRLGVTDFVCEHCRSPLVKQMRTSTCNYEDLKSRINQELAQIEKDVSQLVHLIAQERAEHAAPSETPADSATAARPESVQVHIESHDAIHSKMVAALGNGSAALGAPVVRGKTAPWETAPMEQQEPLAVDGGNPVGKLDVVAFEEILRRQELELNQSSANALITPDKDTGEKRSHERADHDLDSIMVKIQGKPIPLSHVTEDMAQRMTKDEYLLYEQLLSTTDFYEDEFDF